MAEKKVKSTNSLVNLNEFHRNLRHSDKNINYNYDDLENKKINCKRKRRIEVQDLHKSSHEEKLNDKKVNKIKINTKKLPKRTNNKLKNLEENNKISDNEDEGRENEMFNSNLNLSPKRMKTRNSSKQIDTFLEQSQQLSEDLKLLKLSKNSSTPKLRLSRNSLKHNTKISMNKSKTRQMISNDTSIKRLSSLNLKNVLSPSIHQRNANIEKPINSLQEVRLKLHVSAIPKSLPCREEQFNDIYNYLYTKLSDGSSGCIYLSGVPGTGKTATVNEVIRCLTKTMIGNNLTKFKFININGMKLSEPRQTYVQIWKQLTGKMVTWEAAYKLLQSKFTKNNLKDDMILLLVDELDILCTKRQDVVYNLLEWPKCSHAKLVVVTIANTMDLPERILMGKITSRLGLTRLTFPPYNHKQLEQIILCRLQGYNIFSGETLQLVARKVAAVSGDARRALDICRRSTEIAEMNGCEIVSMVDVKKALDEMIANPKIQAIKHCSDLEKNFLKAVCTEVNRTGVEEVVFKNVYFQLHNLCTFNGEKVPNITEALTICARLGSWRLLLCDHSKMDIHQRLLLNATTDDIYFAIDTIGI